MIKDIKSEIKRLKETGTKRDLYRYVILKILDLCIKAFIVVMLIFFARIVLFMIIWGGKPVLNYIMENDRVMSDDQKEIFDYFKGKYDSFYIRDVYDKNNIINVEFGYRSIADNKELSKSLQDMIIYLDDTETRLNETDSIIMRYDHNYDSPDPPIVITNYPDKEIEPGLEKIQNAFDGWMIYHMYFRDWRELEENFNYVEGICSCWVEDIESIKDADTTVWNNLKYIHIDYYRSDADIYEQQLRELFPDAEVHIGD